MTDSMPLPQSGSLAAAPAPASAWRRVLWWTAPALAGAVALYYLVGMAVVNVVDDNQAFASPALKGQSQAVAMAAALIHREVDVHKWTANDPFFQPGWLLDNMPNFQQGIIAAVGRFTGALRDRGQNPEAELERAAGLLKYPGSVWMFDPSTSWAPTASSEKMYRSAARQLEQFNAALARDEYTLSPHAAETLAGVLNVVGADLDALATDAEGHLARPHGVLLNRRVDNLYYSAKGQVYAHSLLLRELGHDFAQVLAEKKLDGDWQALDEALAAAAAPNPLVVLNGAADSWLLANHLAMQGFHILRARQLLSTLAARLSA